MKGSMGLPDRKFFWNAFLLGLTFLSAIAFSLSSMLARFFQPTTLPNLIQLQSTSIFLAFIVQGGLRAGLRNQHHLGRKRMVVEVERIIVRYLPWFALLLSVAILGASRWEFCPAFSILHALLTLLIGLRFAQGRIASAAFWSTLTFVSILVPGALLILTQRPLVSLRPPIEALSLLALFAIARGAQPGRHAITALKKVVQGSLGMQLGAFSVYLLNFCLGQYIVFLSRQDLKVAVAYADIQLICGVQGLIFSRVYLLAEGKILKSGKVLTFSVAALAWTTLFSSLVFSVVYWRQEPHAALVYGVLAFSYLGSIPLGTIAQFMRERYRLESLVITVTAAIVLGAGIWLRVTGDRAAILIALFSPAFIAMVLALRSYFAPATYFIQPSSAR